MYQLWVFIHQDNHQQSIDFDMNPKISLKDEMPSVVDGKFSVSWDFDYFWCLLPWACFSVEESKNLCSSLMNMGVNELYACEKDNYGLQKECINCIPTSDYKAFCVATQKLSCEQQEFLLFNSDNSIILYCNNPADLMAIRLSSGKNFKAILAGFLEVNSKDGESK